MTTTIRFWRRSFVIVSTWRFGLQFDVQCDRCDCTSGGGYSFKGDLWTWDVRAPFTLTSDRSLS